MLYARSVQIKINPNLFLHFKSYAHTIVIAGDRANGVQCRAAAQLAQRLDEREEFLLLKEKADARCRLGGETRHAQYQALELDGMCLLVESIVAIPSLAIDLGIERAVGVEGEIGVRAVEAKLGVILRQVVLYLVGSNLATSLCQEVL